jgi:hypothetical protein
MIGLLLIGLFALIFVSAALAPMESLGWWAGWGAKPPKKNELTEKEAAAATAIPEADFYLVYLSGIGAISGTSVPAEEYPFIYGLRKRLPKAEIISDIYPYSVTNNGLTGQRAFAWLWRGLEKIGQTPGSKLAIMTMVINLRNAFQLFVSADRRYGPVYNLGIANEVYTGLLRHGMHPRSSKPIIMLGWSGGGQIAIGSVEYLAGLPGPIYVISIGGMLSDDPGLKKVDHLWHLYGVADPLQALGSVFFAGRWPIMPQSPWNTAMADGRIDMICLGQYSHNGKGNYFDMVTPVTNDKKGRTHGQKTLDTIVRILNEEGMLSDEDAAAAWKMSVPLETDGVPEVIAQRMEEAAREREAKEREKEARTGETIESDPVAEADSPLEVVVAARKEETSADAAANGTASQSTEATVITGEEERSS